jgi:hypothetical protein
MYMPCVCMGEVGKVTKEGLWLWSEMMAMLGKEFG